MARRECSRAELARKLSAYLHKLDKLDKLDKVDAESDTETLIAAVLDRLVDENLLSDARYAEMLGHSRAGRHGSVRLRQDLRHGGVSESDSETALNEARAGDLAQCHALWLRKFGALPADLKERARQMRFLLSRGFPGSVVSQVLAGLDD